jgi:hypothetical protein
MFERFTEKAIKVIMLAQEESRRLGHNYVGTEQILLGMIGEGTGIAAKVIKSMGVNLQNARVEVEVIIGRGSGFVSVEIPFTPRAKQVLELAIEEARQLQHNYTGTEHLLLGLIREGEGVGVRVLEALGVDLSRVRTQVIKLLRDSQGSFSGSLTGQPATDPRFKIRKLSSDSTQSEAGMDSSDLDSTSTESSMSGGRFSSANKVLAFLSSVIGGRFSSAAAVCQTPEGAWWVEVAISHHRTAPLIWACGGHPYARQNDRWLPVLASGELPAISAEIEGLDVSTWTVLELADLIAAATLLPGQYKGATSLDVIVPGSLGRWVLKRASALGLNVTLCPALRQSLHDSTAAESGVLMVRLQNNGAQIIPASLVHSLIQLPYVIVAEPLVESEAGRLLVDVRHRLPLDPGFVTQLMPANEVWVLGSPDMGYWRMRVTDSETDGALLLNLPAIPTPVPQIHSPAELPSPISVQLAPQPDISQQVDAVLLDDAELSWIRAFLLGQPAGELAFLLPGAGMHLLTAPGGLPSRVPFGVPLTWIGPGALYVELGTGFYPPLSREARQARFQLQSKRVVAVVCKGTYQFDGTRVTPAWSLWLGEAPQVRSGLSQAGEKLLASVSETVRQIEAQRLKSQLLQSQPIDLTNTVSLLQQAQQAELAGNLLQAAEILEKIGYLSQAGRLYERLADSQTG